VGCDRSEVTRPGGSRTSRTAGVIEGRRPTGAAFAAGSLRVRSQALVRRPGSGIGWRLPGGSGKPTRSYSPAVTRRSSAGARGYPRAAHGATRRHPRGGAPCDRLALGRAQRARATRQQRGRQAQISPRDSSEGHSSTAFSATADVVTGHEPAGAAVMERHVAYRQDLLYRDVALVFGPVLHPKGAMVSACSILRTRRRRKRLATLRRRSRAGPAGTRSCRCNWFSPAGARDFPHTSGGTGVRERSIRALGARPERTLVLDDGAGVSCDMRALSQSRWLRALDL
jgi:hypothetical protein